MRVLILALSVLAILISADSATGGPSTTNRDLSASVDPATFEATQETEDQIGLDEGKRRDVQPADGKRQAEAVQAFKFQGMRASI
jgi:hypothetical protein